MDVCVCECVCMCVYVCVNMCGCANLDVCVCEYLDVCVRICLCDNYSDSTYSPEATIARRSIFASAIIIDETIS